jgi:hypothetical protein
MRLYSAANLRQKAGQVISGGLAVLALSAVPAAAQEGSFHDLFGDGYKFLQKMGEGARISVPAGSAAPEGRAFQTLFEDGYAVVWREGQSVGKAEPVEAHQVPEKSPFQAVFGEGYGQVVTPHGR